MAKYKKFIVELECCNGDCFVFATVAKSSEQALHEMLCVENIEEHELCRIEVVKELDCVLNPSNYSRCVYSKNPDEVELLKRYEVVLHCADGTRIATAVEACDHGGAIIEAIKSSHGLAVSKAEVLDETVGLKLQELGNS